MRGLDELLRDVRRGGGATVASGSTGGGGGGGGGGGAGAAHWVNMQDSAGFTPLACAAWAGALDAIARLLRVRKCGRGRAC